MGYNSFARLIAPRHELAAFRRFSKLHTEILLQKQAELLHTEQRIEALRQLPELRQLDKRWLDIEEADGDELDSWKEVFIDASNKLSQYYQALLQAAQLNALQSPKTIDVDFLRKWYTCEKGGGDFLSNAEAGIFRDENSQEDMIILKPDVGPGDHLAEWLTCTIVPLWHRLVGHRIRSSETVDDEVFWEYKRDSMARFGNGLCMILSAVIPAVSILVLCSVSSMNSRLIAITIMSFMFSLIMTIIAQRRADVFTATTAFAAVLVVFVGSTNP